MMGAMEGMGIMGGMGILGILGTMGMMGRGIKSRPKAGRLLRNASMGV